MSRVFGLFEAIFDILYLLITLIFGLALLYTGAGNSPRMLAGAMALVLAFGDAFHLIPRIIVILGKREEQMRAILGRGKQITSITMTVFYLILWHIGLYIFSVKVFSLWTYIIYALAIIRIALCLFPQNRWKDRYPPVNWGIWRNIPFFLMGIIAAGLFFLQRNTILGMGYMWFAIIMSFAFYLPVVIWANRNPKIGILMLPKTCSYLWMIVMCYISIA